MNNEASFKMTFSLPDALDNKRKVKNTSSNDKNDLEVYWGQRVEVKCDIPEGEAILYPFHWKITKENNKVTIPVYQTMTFILLRQKNEMEETEQIIGTIKVVDTDNISTELHLESFLENMKVGIKYSEHSSAIASGLGFFNHGIGRFKAKPISEPEWQKQELDEEIRMKDYGGFGLDEKILEKIKVTPTNPLKNQKPYKFIIPIGNRRENYVHSFMYYIE